MIIVMKSHASPADVANVVRMVEALDYRAHVIRGVERTVVACVGEERGEAHSLTHLESVAGVERVMPVLRTFKLASREVRPEGSIIKVEGSRNRRSADHHYRGSLRRRKPRSRSKARPTRSRQAGAHLIARRRLQAAHLAVLLPGYGRGGGHAA